jgi:hypothetical protein
MAKARHKPEYHATVYDFRDADIMFKIADNTNGTGISSPELAELMGFEAEDGARPIGIRLAWMKRNGMVAYDDRDKLWKLTRGGQRVVDAHLIAPELKVVEKMPDEKKLPKEARDGLMRVWCAILEERTGIKHTPKS